MVMVVLWNALGRLTSVWPELRRELAEARVLDEAREDDVQALITGPDVHAAMARPDVGGEWTTSVYRGRL